MSASPPGVCGCGAGAEAESQGPITHEAGPHRGASRAEERDGRVPEVLPSRNRPQGLHHRKPDLYSCGQRRGRGQTWPAFSPP